MLASERRRVWLDHWLTRVAAAVMGPGIGFLIVVALRDAGLETVVGQTFGAVGLLGLAVGVLLAVVSWVKTRDPVV